MKALGLFSLLLMHFALTCAHVDTFAQDIELIRTSDEQMMQKIDLIQQLLTELKNNQGAMDVKFAGDLNQIREHQAKSDAQNQENAKLLKQLADPSHQEKQCNCVLEKLSPINDKLLQGATLINGLVENSTEMFQQLHETKALVQDCGNAALEAKQISEADLLTKNSTDASPIAKQDEIALSEIATTSEPANKEPEKCFKTNTDINKSNLFFGEKSVFYYENSPMSWYSAQSFCKSIGMELSSLKTAHEISEVYGLIQSYPGYAVWVSASNKAVHKADFSWADNTPLDSSFWRSGFPYYFPIVSKACVWLDPVQGTFADYDCNSYCRPFCQAPYIGTAISCS